MYINVLNTGSSRPSTNDIIIISSSGNYLPPYIGDERKTNGRTKKIKYKYRAERASQQKQRRRGQTVQAIPRTYDEIVTRATKIRYVGTSSVAIVRC